VSKSKKLLSPLSTLQPNEKTSLEKSVERFVGLSLSGGKADRSALVILEHYPQKRRVFISGLMDRVKSEEWVSSDGILIEQIERIEEVVHSIGVDAPLSLPPCLEARCIQGNCTVKSFEKCEQPEVVWMRKAYLAQQKKKPKKMFTPYTTRAVDIYLNSVEEEPLYIQQAFGANLGPLAARAIYLKAKLRVPMYEICTRLSTWRWGLELGVNRSSLRRLRNLSGGEEARQIFLKAFIEKTSLFVYQQDLKLLIENLHVFEAWVCSWVAYLNWVGKTESPFEDCPWEDKWVFFPKRKSL
jgi:hypothetical protein